MSDDDFGWLDAIGDALVAKRLEDERLILAWLDAPFIAAQLEGGSSMIAEATVENSEAAEWDAIFARPPA